MKLIKKFFIILTVLISFIPLSHSQESIVYLDLEKVVSNTKAGKLMISQLEKSKKAALLKFEKKETDLKKEENDIQKQKNIISEEELKKKLFEFRKDVASFRKDRQILINDFNKKKKEKFEEFFKKITPIIENYVSNNNIDMVLDKKNIFVGSKKKNITEDIIKIIDKKIK